jgi:hypothetical protein
MCSSSQSCRASATRPISPSDLVVNRTGGTRRMLPHDFAVSWSATHKHFLRWARDGT